MQERARPDGGEKEIDALNEENRALSARVAEMASRLKQQHRMRFKRNGKPAEPQAGLRRAKH